MDRSICSNQNTINEQLQEVDQQKIQQIKQQDKNSASIRSIKKPPSSKRLINNEIQLENVCRCEFKEKYSRLLQQYSQYRQKSLLEKQKQTQELAKYRQHLDRTYTQMKNKFDSKIQQFTKDQIKKSKISVKKLQEELIESKQHEKTKEQQIIHLKQEIRKLQVQKLTIIENHSEMLYQISVNEEFGQQIDENQNSFNKGKYKHSYQQLGKLYQIVLEQNNNLKKQICKVNQKLYDFKHTYDGDNIKKNKIKSQNKSKNPNHSVLSHNESIKKKNKKK